MKLKRVFVSNYRFFDSLEINFLTSGENCSTGIYGHNGTGKTTVLKLVRLLTSTVHQYFDYLKSSGVDEKQKKFLLLFSLDEAYKRLIDKLGNINLELEFENTKASPVKISLKEGKIWLGSSPLNHILSKDGKNEFPEIVSQFKNFHFYPSIAQVQGDLFRRHRVNSSVTEKNAETVAFVDKLLPFLSDPDEAVNGLVQNRLTKTELDELSKQYKDFANNNSSDFAGFKGFIDGILEGKTLASVKDDVVWFSIKRSKEKSELIQYEELSAGERHIFTTIVKLYVSKCSNGVLIFDEPETSFHFEWQQRLLEIFHNVPGCKNNQIIFASHSEDLAKQCGQFIYFSQNRDSCRIEVTDSLDAING